MRAPGLLQPPFDRMVAPPQPEQPPSRWEKVLVEQEGERFRVHLPEDLEFRLGSVAYGQLQGQVETLEGVEGVAWEDREVLYIVAELSLEELQHAVTGLLGEGR